MSAAPTADSYEDDPDTPGERRLCSSSIAPPLELSVTEEELRLLRSVVPGDSHQLNTNRSVISRL